MYELSWWKYPALFFVRSSCFFYEQLFRPVLVYVCQLSAFRSMLGGEYIQVCRDEMSEGVDDHREDLLMAHCASASFRRYCDDVISNEYVIDFSHGRRGKHCGESSSRTEIYPLLSRSLDKWNSTTCVINFSTDVIQITSWIYPDAIYV